MIVREPYYRNWTATIDGRSAEVRPAGGFFIGVRVGAGAHAISLRYREPGFARGVVVALLAAMVLVGLHRRGGRSA